MILHFWRVVILIAETTHIPLIFIPSRTERLFLFRPPIAFTGIGTALHISESVCGEVMTVFTLVVVGYIAPTPQ